MGARIRGLSSPLLYNYQYDQLNRLIHMDAWNRTSTPWSAITKIPDFQEGIKYDPNGNILGYRRNGSSTTSLAMDSLNYSYISGTNKLDHITDSVTSTCSGCGDITTQSTGNYQYDSIGELIGDAQLNISNITWTVYGKIASITKGGDSTMKFTYDAGGRRVSKTVIHSGDTVATWYVRDAQGNILSVYTYGDPSVNAKDLTQTELDVYGSSRLGMWKRNVDVEVKPPAPTLSMPLLGSADTLIFTRGNKLFELTNHLGNVLSTISDKRYGISTDDSTVTYFNPDVVSANDYYPFGMLEPGRQFAQSNLGGYRYGFNGKENDNEVKGAGAQIDYGMRVYDPRVGRFYSIDPLFKKFPGLSTYQYASNRPIDGIDQDGMEWMSHMDQVKYNGSAWDYLKWIPNAAGDVWNGIVVDTWNSGVATVKSLGRGTYLKDVSHDFKQLGSTIKQTAVNTAKYTANTSIGQQFADAGTTLLDPRTWETGLAIYIGSKIPFPGGSKGNLLKPATNVASAANTELNITMGVAKNGGQSLSTAVKTGAPYYSEWAKIGIYNPNNFEGWGSAFKYITDKVLASKGTINFELAGLNIGEALAGDSKTWVARYTAWELQQIVEDPKLFKSTDFYMNGVKQTAEDLNKLGIKQGK